MQEQIAVCVSDFPCFTANGENFAKIGERSAVIAALRAKNNEKNCSGEKVQFGKTTELLQPDALTLRIPIFRRHL